MRVIVLLIALVMTMGVNAAETDVTRRVQEAEAYFQNGQYEKAAVSYKNLLQMDLKPQQEALVRYNLGTALLQMGDAEEAIRQFQEVHAEEGTPALIRLRLHANEASAYLSMVLARLSNWDPESKTYVKDGEGSLRLALDGLKAVSQALAAQLEMELVEGRPSGGDPIGLVKLRKDLRQEYARIHQALRDYQLQNTHLLEGSKTIAERLEDRRNALDILGMASNGQKQQLQRMAIAEKALYPLWEALRSQLTQAEQVDESRLNLFLQAEQQFYSAVELMQEGQMWSSRKSVAKALLLARTLHQIEAEQDPIDHLLEERIVLRERLVTAENDASLRDALEQEELDYSQLSELMLRSLAEQLSTAPEEEKDPKERLLAQRLLLDLADQLRSAVDTNDYSTEFAWQNLRRYRHIAQDEGQSLAAIRVKLEKLMEADAQESLATLLAEWRAVEHKLSIRQELSEGKEEGRILATRQELLAVNELEEAALSGDATALQQLYMAVTRALYAWDLESLITAELHSLATAYNRRLKEKSYPKEDVTYLLERVNGLEEWVRISPMRDLRQETYTRLDQSLVEVQRYSAQSQTIAEVGSDPLAKLFLTAAKNTLIRALRNWQEQAQSPADILEVGILEQTIALQYNRGAQDLSLIQGLQGMWETLLLESQNHVVASVEDFPNAALNALSQGSGQPPADPTVLWESEPWNQVMALFEAGLLAATDAQELLASDPAETGPAQTKQQEAIDYWKQALELLKDQSEGDQGDGDSDEDQPDQDQSQSQDEDSEDSEGQDESQPEDSETREEEAQATGELLEMLQTMYQDDQIQDQKKMPAKQGLRPW